MNRSALLVLTALLSASIAGASEGHDEAVTAVAATAAAHSPDVDVTAGEDLTTPQAGVSASAAQPTPVTAQTRQQASVPGSAVAVVPVRRSVSAAWRDQLRPDVRAALQAASQATRGAALTTAQVPVTVAAAESAPTVWRAQVASAQVKPTPVVTAARHETKAVVVSAPTVWPAQVTSAQVTSAQVTSAQVTSAQVKPGPVVAAARHEVKAVVVHAAALHGAAQAKPALPTVQVKAAAPGPAAQARTGSVGTPAAVQPAASAQLFRALLTGAPLAAARTKPAARPERAPVPAAEVETPAAHDALVRNLLAQSAARPQGMQAVRQTAVRAVTPAAEQVMAPQAHDALVRDLLAQGGAARGAPLASAVPEVMAPQAHDALVRDLLAQGGAARGAPLASAVPEVMAPRAHDALVRDLLAQGAAASSRPAVVPVAVVPVAVVPVAVVPVAVVPVAVIPVMAPPALMPAPAVKPLVLAAPVSTVTLTDVPAGHWARDAVELLLSRGLLLGYPDGTFRGNRPITRYEAAMVFVRFLDSGLLAKSGLAQADLAVIARGVADVADEVMSVGSRVGTLETREMSREARLARIEGQVAQLAGLLGSALPDTANAASRLSAVESAVNALPAVLDSKAMVGQVNTVSSNVAALQAQVTGLSAQNADAQTRLKTLEDAASFKATLPAALPEPVPHLPSPKRFEVGVSGEGTVTPPGLKYGAAVEFGAANLIGPVGVRASAFSRPSAQAFGGDLALTAAFNIGGIFPYVGLGAGLVSSPSRADVMVKTSDAYALGTLGLDYPINDSLSLYGEGQGRYFFGNRGYGTGLSGTAASGVALGFRAGVRFRF